MIGSQQEFQAPDYLEPLIGYRIWRVLDNKLCGPYKLNSGGFWNISNVLEARCRKDHPAPASNCECGLYAFFDSKPLKIDEFNLVGGQIKAWGNIEIHEQGFRAQYASIQKLYYPKYSTFTQNIPTLKSLQIRENYLFWLESLAQELQIPLSTELKVHSSLGEMGEKNCSDHQNKSKFRTFDKILYRQNKYYG